MFFRIVVSFPSIWWLFICLRSRQWIQFHVKCIRENVSSLYMKVLTKRITHTHTHSYSHAHRGPRQVHGYKCIYCFSLPFHLQTLNKISLRQSVHRTDIRMQFKPIKKVNINYKLRIQHPHVILILKIEWIQKPFSCFQVN